jgi:hypothetical protein
MDGWADTVDSLAIEADSRSAAESYLKTYRLGRDGWPRGGLLFRARNGAGAVLATDRDGQTLIIDVWGPGAAEHADSLFDLVWESVRRG